MGIITAENEEDWGELLANKGSHYSAPVIYCHRAMQTLPNVPNILIFQKSLEVRIHL